MPCLHANKSGTFLVSLRVSLYQVQSHFHCISRSTTCMINQLYIFPLDSHVISMRFNPFNWGPLLRKTSSPFTEQNHILWRSKFHLGELLFLSHSIEYMSSPKVQTVHQRPASRSSNPSLFLSISSSYQVMCVL